MTLIEAIKSGEKFKRAMWPDDDWITNKLEIISLRRADIVADDWEVMSHEISLDGRRFDMNEEIKLLTACGCSRMVEITDNAREYICAIKTNEPIEWQKSDVFPTEPLTYKKRFFRYKGQRMKDTHIKIFEEII